jgi:hypothetical protein
MELNEVKLDQITVNLVKLRYSELNEIKVSYIKLGSITSLCIYNMCMNIICTVRFDRF